MIGIVQLGGEDANAVPTFLRTLEATLFDELTDIWSDCKIFNAWNISMCMDGTPLAAPFNTVAHQGDTSTNLHRVLRHHIVATACHDHVGPNCQSFMKQNFLALLKVHSVCWPNTALPLDFLPCHLWQMRDCTGSNWSVLLCRASPKHQ